ncbi:MAG: peptidase [Chloroflexi bacterium]|nr:peptidase [Chloroflexota bacterium]
MRHLRPRPPTVGGPGLFVAIIAIIAIGGLGVYVAIDQLGATPRLTPASASNALLAVATRTSVPSTTPIPRPTPEDISLGDETITATTTATPTPEATPTATAEVTATIEPSPTESPTPTPEPTTTSVPTAQPTATRPAAVLDHVVVPGDTISSIAALYGVPSAAIISTNRLSQDGTIQVGQALLIPRVFGAVHTVRPGESLGEIAALYGVQISAIADANDLSDPSAIFSGQRLLIPGAVAPIPTSTPAPTLAPPLPTATARPMTATAIATATPGRTALPGTSTVAPTTTAPVFSIATRPPQTGGPGPAILGWPARGGISTEFGDGGHSGIDIMANTGDPVAAAAPGIVTMALESDYGYGWRVEIDHGGGIGTLYAHMSAFTVKPGERVIQGQRLGYAGSTGVSTGPHLHFEVRLAGVPTDPLRFLP